MVERRQTGEVFSKRRKNVLTKSNLSTRELLFRETMPHEKSHAKARRNEVAQQEVPGPSFAFLGAETLMLRNRSYRGSI